MFKRFTLISLTAASFMLAAPAFADGTGKGPTYTAPAPLTPQPYTGYKNQDVTTTCQTTCSHSGGHTSHSGLPTDPVQSCCGHVPATVYHPSATVVNDPIPIVHVQVPQGLLIDTTSFTGGVGVGVNDVFVGGGGFFGGGLARSSFGARSSGVFAVRNAAFQRRFGGVRRGGGLGRRKGGGIR